MQLKSQLACPPKPGAARRPRMLIAQAQENLRAAETARRQQLWQQSDASGGTLVGSPGSHRPPQLPGTGYPSPGESLGSITAGGSSSSSYRAASPRLPVLSPSSGVSEHVPTGLPVVRSPSTTMRTKQSGESTPRKRPSSRDVGRSSGSLSSSRRGGSMSRSHRAPSESPRQKEEGDTVESEASDDAEFQADLADLAELCGRLGVSAGPSEEVGLASSTGAAELLRPGTSASASTAAPPLSVDGRLEREEDLVLDTWAQGDLSLPIAQRLYQELQSTKLPPGCRTDVVSASSSQFFVILDVAEGPYTPATLTFWVKLFEDFPKPGSWSIRSQSRLFHPSVEPTTRRFELTQESLAQHGPSSSIRDLILALRQAILEPCATPAVNSDAAVLLQTDSGTFRRTVRLTLNGGDYSGVKYDPVLSSASKGTKLSREGSRRNSTPDPVVSDQVRIGLMGLEVVREDFRKQAAQWIKQNNDELLSLQSATD